jgi:prepilin-type N-terminal cleavage/methylation domain-containing protein
MRSRQKEYGFTLIELLTVIGVFGILLVINLVSIQNVRRSADLSDGVSALRNVGTAMSLFVMVNGGQLPWSAQDTQYAFRRRQDNHDQLIHQLMPYFGLDLENLPVDTVVPGSVGKAYVRERDPLRYPPYKTNAAVLFSNGEIGRPFGRRDTGSGGDTTAQHTYNVESPSRQVAMTDVDILLRTEDGRLSEPTRDELVYTKRLLLYFDWRAEVVEHDFNYYYRKLW